MRPRYLLLQPLLWCLLMLCPSISAATQAAFPSVDKIVFQPYALVTERHGTIPAEIGYFEVPRRYSAPDGRAFRLRVVRLPASRQPARNPPIVYLAGGPGGSAVGTARGDRWPVFDAVRRDADVLLLDQRGTGGSGRPPECAFKTSLDPTRAWSQTQQLAALQATAQRCVASWRSQGLDLDAFNSIDSAHDVEMLRRAVGAPTLNLWGMSYGTHLALAVLRYHGDHIGRAVLMGSEGLDSTLKRPLTADRVLQRIADLASRDAAVRELNPDLVRSMQRVFDRLGREPVRARLPWSTQHVVIGRFDAQLAAVSLLGRTDVARYLPLIFAKADQGDYGPLAFLVLEIRKALGEFSAMPLAMDVASGASPQRRALIARAQARSIFGSALNFPIAHIGDGLGIADVGSAFRAPLHSAVPVLFISGTLDARTPPGNAESLRGGFASSVHLVLQGAAHDDDLWLSSPQVVERIQAFFGGSRLRDETLTVAPMSFATSVPGELLTVLGIEPWMLMVAALGFLVPIGWLSHRRYRRV